MPTYQYACTDPACKHEFELVQSFTDPAASECPVCGHTVRKKFSAVGVVFKGSGFYRTDSRSDSKAKSNGSAKSDSSGSSGDSGAKGSKESSSAKDAGSSTSAKPAAAGSGSGSGSGGSSKAAASA